MAGHGEFDDGGGGGRGGCRGVASCRRGLAGKERGGRMLPAKEVGEN